MKLNSVDGFEFKEIWKAHSDEILDLLRDWPPGTKIFKLFDFQRRVPIFILPPAEFIYKAWLSQGSRLDFSAVKALVLSQWYPLGKAIKGEVPAGNMWVQSTMDAISHYPVLDELLLKHAVRAEELKFVINRGSSVQVEASLSTLLKKILSRFKDQVGKGPIEIAQLEDLLRELELKVPNKKEKILEIATTAQEYLWLLNGERELPGKWVDWRQFLKLNPTVPELNQMIQLAIKNGKAHQGLAIWGLGRIKTQKEYNELDQPDQYGWFSSYAKAKRECKKATQNNEGSSKKWFSCL